MLLVFLLLLEYIQVELLQVVVAFDKGIFFVGDGLQQIGILAADVAAQSAQTKIGDEGQPVGWLIKQGQPADSVAGVFINQREAGQRRRAQTHGNIIHGTHGDDVQQPEINHLELDGNMGQLQHQLQKSEGRQLLGNAQDGAVYFQPCQLFSDSAPVQIAIELGNGRQVFQNGIHRKPGIALAQGVAVHLGQGIGFPIGK